MPEIVMLEGNVSFYRVRYFKDIPCQYLLTGYPVTGFPFAGADFSFSYWHNSLLSFFKYATKKRPP